MGKISLFTKGQKIIFDQIRKTGFFKENFYFTGGTALSLFYLQHRYSLDLDFFSPRQFNRETVISYVSQWAQKYNFTFTAEFKEVVYIFLLTFRSQKTLKVDFGYYPHTRVEKGIVYKGVVIDSLLDIAINKLFTINQRANIKDFVDLYFLLEKFTIWDLIEGVRVKFRMKVEPWLLSSDLLAVEEFTYLPKMIKPLTLPELKKFFRQKAQQLAKRVVEE